MPFSFHNNERISSQAMATEALEMEGRVPGWRPGLIPFAKEFDGTFLVSNNLFGFVLIDWMGAHFIA